MWLFSSNNEPFFLKLEDKVELFLDIFTKVARGIKPEWFQHVLFDELKREPDLKGAFASDEKEEVIKTLKKLYINRNGNFDIDVNTLISVSFILEWDVYEYLFYN